MKYSKNVLNIVRYDIIIQFYHLSEIYMANDKVF